MDRRPSRISRCLAAGSAFTLGVSLFASPAAVLAATPCVASNALDLSGRPTHGGARVLQICSNGSVVGSATGEGTTYKTGEELPDGSTLSTPPGVTIDFVTLNGNVVRAYSGNTWRLGSVAKGDFMTAIKGKLDFVVKHALGAFGVYAAPVYGLVPGTEFGVDEEPDTSVEFSCTEGRVRLTREVTVHLQQENKDVNGVRQSEFIAAAGPEPSSRKYLLPLPVLTFANAAAARSYIQQQRQSALQNGDEATVEDSEFNELQIEQTVAPAAPGQAQNTTSSQQSANSGSTSSSTTSASTSPASSTAGTTAATTTATTAASSAAVGATSFIPPLALAGLVGVGLATGVIPTSPKGLPSANATNYSGSVTVNGIPRRRPARRITLSLPL